MKKRNCRKIDVEREQHDRAIRVRKMTDAQLCDYLDGLGVTRAEPQPSKEEIITAFLEAITIRRDDGLRVSDATVRKLKAMARRDGFLPPLPELDDDML